MFVFVLAELNMPLGPLRRSWMTKTHMLPSMHLRWDVCTVQNELLNCFSVGKKYIITLTKLTENLKFCCLCFLCISVLFCHSFVICFFEVQTTLVMSVQSVNFFGLTPQVLESVVKNCGQTVHDEVASKQTMEELKDLLKVTFVLLICYEPTLFHFQYTVFSTIRLFQSPYLKVKNIHLLEIWP